MNNLLMQKLLPLAEPEYKSFSERLSPGGAQILGVRLPALRSIAKELAKADYSVYFTDDGFEYLEELLLRGMIIGYIKADDETRITLLRDFVPRINGWSVCDSSCATYKFMERRPDIYRSFIKEYAYSEKEFESRFFTVCATFHFVTPEYIDELLEVLVSIKNDGYYAKMAVAWALCDCFIKFPEKTMRVFLDGSLCDFTHNKAISKICDSYRVGNNEKLMLKALRR